MYGVGVIGAGVVGESHARAIHAVDGLQLVAASRTDAGALDAFVGRHGGVGYTDYRELLERRDIDCVCIALPHYLHREAVELAAQAGKHILLEKPLGPTIEECDQILDSVKTHGVKMMLGHTTRFAPAVRRAKELLSEGQVGEVISSWGAAAKKWESARRREWHRDRLLGGGMWLTNGVHLIDRMMWLIDRPVESVKGVVACRMHDQKADDTAAVFLTFQGGVTSALFAHGYREGAPEQITELFCSDGCLRIDLASGLHVGHRDAWELVPGTESPWAPPAMEAQWEAFRRYLDDEIPNPVSSEFARGVMASMFAAERSSASGREVTLSPPVIAG